MQKISTANGHGASVAAGVDITKPGDTIDVATKMASIVGPFAKQVKYGSDADAGCSPVPVSGKRETCVDDIDRADVAASATTINSSTLSSSSCSTIITPRLEMRLALNHEIMGDEDLIGFEPRLEANLAAILNRDLSSYHRFTGRDLISRSASRVGPKETAHISFSQQKNSKMDTPTPNRKKSNQNIWNSSASVAASEYAPSEMVWPSATMLFICCCSHTRARVGTGKNLSDLERLAKLELKSKTTPVEHRSTNRTVKTDCDRAKTATKSKKL